MPDQGAADRRALKKSQTRVAVRRAAQRLFAERSFAEVTVADVAAAADVAVQTVFNHFATKEDLYFADRAPWVSGPAAAVSGRQPGTGAVVTAHAWLTQQVVTVPPLYASPAHRRYLETILASPSLRVHQRELFRAAEDRLAAALQATWAAELGDLPGLRLAAALTGGLLLTCTRVVLAEQWAELSPVAAEAPELADLVAAVQLSSRQAMDAVGGGFAELAARDVVPEALRAVSRLETERPADAQVALVPPSGLLGLPQEPAATTGSSTVSTRSTTSSVVIGTAKAV